MCTHTCRYYNSSGVAGLNVELVRDVCGAAAMSCATIALPQSPTILSAELIADGWTNSTVPRFKQMQLPYPGEGMRLCGLTDTDLS